MFKRIIALLLILIMLLGTVACNDNDITSKNEEISSLNSEVSSVISQIENTGDSTSDTDDTSKTDSTSRYDNTSPESSGKEPIATTSTYVEKEPGVLDLKIYNSKILNSDWNGVNVVDQGFMFLPDEYGRGYTDAQIEEELKRMADMDINMVRSYMDAGYAFVKHEGDEIIYDWDSAEMQGFYKWLDAMKERNIEVVVNMGWSVGSIASYTNVDTAMYEIPWFASGNSFTYPEKIDIYTEWVEFFIKEVIIKRGYNIEYFVMFTEPYAQREYDVIIDADGTKVKKDGWDVAVDVIRATDDALKEAGLRDMVKLTGPQIGISTVFYRGNTFEDDINWWIEQIDECIDVYTFHWYVPTWPGFSPSSSAALYDDNYDLWLYYFGRIVDLVSKTGKPYWLDEWNYGGNSTTKQEEDFYAQQIAQSVVAAMNSGINNAIYWQLFEIVWPKRSDTGGEFDEGIHTIGTAPSLYESSIPYKLYYGFGLLAKYCGELDSSTYLGSGKKGVYCSMVEYEKNGENYQNVIVVNTSSLEQKISLDFEKSIGKDMYRYLYDPLAIEPNTAAEMISADKGFKNVDTILQDTVPAGSIVVYSTVNE